MNCNLLPFWSNLRFEGNTKNLWWSCVLRPVKNRYWIFEHKEILRCKRNSISNVSKDVFSYNFFSLDFQLMKVTEYLLIDRTNILVKFLSQEIKRCSCKKTKRAENWGKISVEPHRYEHRGVSIFFAFAILISNFNFISNYL